MEDEDIINEDELYIFHDYIKTFEKDTKIILSKALPLMNQIKDRNRDLLSGYDEKNKKDLELIFINMENLTLELTNDATAIRRELPKILIEENGLSKINKNATFLY